MLTTNAVLAAIAAPEATAFGVRLQPLTLAHIVAIERAVPHYFGAASGPQPPLTLLHHLYAFHLLTLPARETIAAAAQLPSLGNSGKELGNSGKEEQALLSISSSLFPTETLTTELARVSEHIAAAFATHIRARDVPRRSCLEGLGLVAELTDFLMSEYRMSYDEAFFATPLNRAYILLAATHQRNGGKFGGPVYVNPRHPANRPKK